MVFIPIISAAPDDAVMLAALNAPVDIELFEVDGHLHAIVDAYFDGGVQIISTAAASATVINTTWGHH